MTAGVGFFTGQVLFHATNSVKAANALNSKRTIEINEVL